MKRIRGRFLPNKSEIVGAMPKLERELAVDTGVTQESLIARLQEAVMNDLAYILNLQGDEPISGELDEFLSIRYAWLVDTLRDLNQSGSIPSRRKMFAFWLVVAIWQQKFEIRHALLQDVQLSEEFFNELALLISSFSFEIAIPDHAPSHEKELFEKILTATQTENWEVLIEHASKNPLHEAQPWREQAIRCLYQWAPSKLAEILSDSQNWMHAAVIFSSLTHIEAFDVAVTADKACVYFAALASVETGEKVDSSTFQVDLTALITAMSFNRQSWIGILKAFNKYPVRYPWLQSSLGTALARASQERVLEYASTVQLSNSEGCALQLDICLANFNAHAPADLRRVLWKRAYENWSCWNFQQSGGPVLTNPTFSTLDYAVVGWLKEGCTEVFVTSELERIEQQVNVLERDWHESLTSFNSKLNALLSRYQVFAQARDSRGADWLGRGEMKIPGSLGGAYKKLRYGQ